MKVKFEGGRELETALKALDISTTRKRNLAARALDRAAVPIRDEWATHVDVQSGDLKRSIKIGPRAQTKATRKFFRGAGKDIVERYVGIDPTEGEDLEVYAYIEEFGNEGQPANPAGRQAWEGKKMEAFNRIGTDLWDEINKTARREAAKTARLKK